MKKVILTNRTKRPPRMLILELTKQVAPVKVTNRTTDEAKDGTRLKRISTKIVPDVLRIPSKTETLPVPESYLQCPAVKEARARREISVRDAPPEEKNEPKKRTRKPGR